MGSFPAHPGDDFPMLADALPVIVWMTDAEGRAVLLNRAAFEYAGLGFEQIDGDGWRDLFHPDDLPAYEKLMADATAERRPYATDCRVRHADGRFRWLLLRGVPRLTPGGAFAGFTGCGVDITDRKEAEARLRAEVAERRQAEQASLAQRGALVRTLNGLAANPSLDAYLGEVLKALAEQLDEPMAGLWLTEGEDVVRLYMDYQDGRAVLASQTDHPGAQPVPPNSKYLRGLTTRPQVFDVANDPAVADYRPYMLARGVQGILVVPMFFGRQTIGAFSVRSTRRKTFAPGEVELAQTLAHQATLAIQLTRLAQNDRDSAVLEERNRMAREIHDTLAQSFTGIVIHQEALKRLLPGCRPVGVGEHPSPDDWPSRAADVKQHIARTLELARTGLAEARRSVGNLRSVVVEAARSQGRDDLPAALSRLVEQMTAATDVRGEVVLHGPPRPLPPPVRAQLQGIGQEALTNALRHGHPSRVRVELTFDPQSVRLRVWDDGRGFDPASTAATGEGGFGLRGMRERAGQVGGRLFVTSQPQGGTEVIMEVGT